ncbi:MAG: DUF1858 domain-containing protein, partial [Nitrospirae bacterium]|nr:DUF1858 domain-containing protein [Nitrospirota bacterium]
MKEIRAETKIHEIIKNYPELTDYFLELGLCGCGIDSGLLWTVQRMAREKNLDLEEILRELN